jgi:hypothetical protein
MKLDGGSVLFALAVLAVAGGAAGSPRRRRARRWNRAHRSLKRTRKEARALGAWIDGGFRGKAPRGRGRA